MVIYLATSNNFKLIEIKKMLHSDFIDLRIDPSYSLLNVEEVGDSFEANASIKALALSNIVDDLVIADDSGLVIPALNGEPGIYSARYASGNSQDVSYEANNKLVLDKMKAVEDRSAYYVTVVALALKGTIIKTFSGELWGEIGKYPRGTQGFGYDPIFKLQNGLTVAEISLDEKNAISHRAIALKKLSAFLDSYSV